MVDAYFDLSLLLGPLKLAPGRARVVLHKPRAVDQTQIDLLDAQLPYQAQKLSPPRQSASQHVARRSTFTLSKLSFKVSSIPLPSAFDHFVVGHTSPPNAFTTFTTSSSFL